MALRQLAQTAATRGRLEDAAVLLGASRRNMPAYGLDPAIDGPLEQRCRDRLGAVRYGQLVEQGAALTHAELLDVVDAPAGATGADVPSGPRVS